MSFLATLFSQSRFERKSRVTASRHDVMKRVRKIISSSAQRSKRRTARDIELTCALSASEQLEPRIALSVSQFGNENLVERAYSNFNNNSVPWNSNPSSNVVGGSVGNKANIVHSGQVTVASDAGSNVFIQQLDLDPAQLLIADNGSFLNYTAFDDFANNFDDLLVTNGSKVEFEEDEVVAAKEWWLFPDRDDPTTFKTTRLLLDRPNIRVGPDGNANDFFGSVKMLQGDGTIAKWTFSAWEGQGNLQGNFITITQDGQDAFGDELYITGGPGFGGRPESLNNTTETEVQAQGGGYVFPRSIRVVTEGAGQGEGTGSDQRSHYLECRWSSTPTSPPLFEVDYYGFSWDPPGTPGRQNVREYRGNSPQGPTLGVATRSANLIFELPDAIVGTSTGGSGSLGIVPGTVRGTVEFGVDKGDEESIPSNNFQDRRNLFPQNSFLEDTGYSLFYTNLDEADQTGGPQERQFGKPQSQPSPDVFEPIDHVIDSDNQRQLGISGFVRNQSELFMEVSSYAGNNPNLGYQGGDGARPLRGFNVEITEATIRNGKAKDAVRVKDVSYLVFVKPTISNDVTFAPGGTIERNVTVDLLSDGSSIFVNSPIEVSEPGGDLDFRATNIFVNAATTSPDYFFVGRSENQNEGQERLPRAADEPQGGTRQTPTFGTTIPDTVVTRTVLATPIIKLDPITLESEISELVVLPGNEGYGYDKDNPPTVSFGNPGVTTAEVEIETVSGGVGQLILLGSGVNYPADSEQVSVNFDDPQLRRIASLERWTSSPNSEGYSAAPALAISEPEVVNSAVRIGYGERGRSRAAEGDGLAIKLVNSGAKYTTSPSIKVQLTQQAKDAGIAKYDPNIVRDLEWARSMPSLTLKMDIRDIKGTTGGDTPQPTSTYVSGKVDSITTQDPGWGLNLTGMDRETETSFLEDINERFEIVVTGGNGNPGLGGTILTGWPIGGQVNHATFEFDRAFLGGLKWLDVPFTNGENPEEDARSLLNAGLNYQLSPDVQFFTNLTAFVPEPNPELAAEGEDTRETVHVPPLLGDLPADLTYATHKVSLKDIFAYRDDAGYDAEGNRLDPTKFRKGAAYLSYANDPLHADNVVAKLSNDGINFYDVLVQPFIGLGDTYEENVDPSWTVRRFKYQPKLAEKLSAGDFVVGAYTFPQIRRSSLLILHYLK